MRNRFPVTLWLALVALVAALALPARANTWPFPAGQPAGRSEYVPRGAG